MSGSSPTARQKARGYALQVLFALDSDDAQPLDKALASYWKDFDVDVPEDVRDFAASLTYGTRAALARLDETIQETSQNWRVDRMSQVDRNILRLGTYELAEQKDVPARVILNEAVELAKRFGTETSASFVNGILDQIAKRLRPEE